MDDAFADLMSPDALLATVRTYNPKTNEALIRTAFEYGERMHEGQKRHSGEPLTPIKLAMHKTQGRHVYSKTGV